MLYGESALSFVHETYVPVHTLHRWKHQPLVDQVLIDCLECAESAQLHEAKKSSRLLGQEGWLLKRALAYVLQGSIPSECFTRS